MVWLGKGPVMRVQMLKRVRKREILLRVRWVVKSSILGVSSIGDFLYVLVV